MKIDKAEFRVLSDGIPLEDKLRIDLNSACFMFTKSNTKDVIQDAKVLSVDMRVAIGQYLTGLKVQNFANSAAVNDNITLEIEVNDFLKSYNKLTK